jgi:uncharacterized protein (TIGR02145 family)
MKRNLDLLFYYAISIASIFKNNTSVLLKGLFRNYFFIYIFLVSISSCKKDNNNNSNPATVTDIDGNVYNTITIGTQVWMKENLKTTRYRNGDPILTGLSDNEWTTTSSGHYAIFHYTVIEDTLANNAVYGKLYNWFAVSDPRNIAPVGWHVPSKSEWNVLVNYLGGTDVAGDKMKEAGQVHWVANTTATNSSGFTGLPGGGRSSYDGTFVLINQTGYWWSSTPDNTFNTWVIDMGASFTNLFIDSGDKHLGASVRCIKD